MRDHLLQHLSQRFLSSLNRTLGLRGRDWPVFSLMMAHIFLALALMISLRSLNTGLFLSAYPASVYPWYFLAEALLSFVLSLVYGQWISGRFGRRVENYGILWAFIAVIVLGRLLLMSEYSWVSFAMLTFCEAMSALLMIQSWGLFGDVIDSRKARRIFPLIGLGGTCGAIFGGSIVSQFAKVIGTLSFYWFMPAFLLLMILVVRALHRVANIQEENLKVENLLQQEHKLRLSQQLQQAIRGVTANRLVLMVLLITLCVRVASTIMDFQLQLQLKSHFAEDEISAYMGSFFALTSLATLMIQLAFEHRFLNAYGVVWGLALTPMTLCLGVGGFFLSPTLWSITLAKFIETLGKNSMFKTAVELVYIPFETQDRKRLRMLANGLVALTTVPLATCVILIFQHQPAVLLWTALGFALLGILFSILLQGPYLKKLNDALLHHPEHFWGTGPRHNLSAEDLEELLTQGEPELIRFVLEHLNAEQIQIKAQQLRALIFHENPNIREGIIRLLQDESEITRQLLSDSLQYDKNQAVRLASAKALRKVGSEQENWQFLPLLKSEHSALRAEALIFLFTRGGIEGILAGASHLQNMLTESSTEALETAAYVIGEIGIRYFRQDFLSLLHHDDPGVQQAALKAAQVSLPGELLPELAPFLERPPCAVLVQAIFIQHPAELVLPQCRQLIRQFRQKRSILRDIIGILGHYPTDESCELLFELLIEPDIVVKYAVIQALQNLKHTHEFSLTGEKRRIEAQLQREFYYGYHFVSFLAQARQELKDNPEFRLLHDELELRLARVHEMIFRLLSLLYDSMEEALMSFQSGSSRLRALSLELVSYVVNQKELAVILNLMDDVALSQKILMGREQGYLEAEMPAPWWGHPLVLEDHWLRRLSQWSYRRQGLIAEEQQLFETIETMHLLKKTQLFRSFSAEQLYPVAQAAQSILVPAQSYVFRQGQTGDAFYIIQSGRVAIERHRKQVAQLGVLEGFGELEIIKGAPRMASAVSLEASELLKIQRADFIRLLDASPAFSRSILEVLSERLSHHVLKFGATGPLALEDVALLDASEARD